MSSPLTAWRSVRLCARGWPSWSMDHSSVWVAYNTSRTSKESSTSVVLYGITVLSNLCRYGQGLILQAKIQLSSPAPEEEAPQRRASLIRRVATIFRRSTRRSKTRRDEPSTIDEICEDSSREEPLSPTKSPTSRVPLRRQLTRRISRLFSQSDDLPKPDPKPRYNTAPFHQFMSNTFPKSVKLEEHQVYS